VGSLRNGGFAGLTVRGLLSGVCGSGVGWASRVSSGISGLVVSRGGVAVGLSAVVLLLRLVFGPGLLLEPRGVLSLFMFSGFLVFLFLFVECLVLWVGEGCYGRAGFVLFLVVLFVEQFFLVASFLGYCFVLVCWLRGLLGVVDRVVDGFSRFGGRVSRDPLCVGCGCVSGGVVGFEHRCRAQRGLIRFSMGGEGDDDGDGDGDGGGVGFGCFVSLSVFLGCLGVGWVG